MKSFLKSKNCILFLALQTVLILWFLVSVSHADSKKPSIEDVSVKTNSQDLIISARLKNGLKRDIIDAINSGLTTTLNFHLELKSDRFFWFDMGIVSRTIKHTVKYNPILKEYTFISQDDKGENTKVTLDFSSLTEWMQNLEEIHLIPLSLLERDRRYYIRIKAQMGSSSLFIPLTRLLFFVSFGNFETSWVSSQPFVIKGYSGENDER